MGYVNIDDTYVDNLTSMKFDTLTTITLPDDIKNIRFWIEPSYRISTGDITIRISHKANIYEDIRELLDDTYNLQHIDKKVVGYDPLVNIEATQSITCTASTSMTTKLFDSFNEKEKLFLKVTDEYQILNTKLCIVVGVGYLSGEVQSVMSLKPNEEYTLTLNNEKAEYIHFWIDGANIIGSGSLTFRAANFSEITLMERVENIENNRCINKTESRTFSILGDSYSTYKDWIYSNFGSWYADEGNSSENNVSSVKDTWWWLLSNEAKLTLLTNNSSSGSTICNTGYDGEDTTRHSFITRMKMDYGVGKTTNIKPNILFILGGTNDSWADSPVGSLKYSGWTDEDLKSFLPAFCYMLDYIKIWSPATRIINLINTGLKDEIVSGMKTACQYYDVEFLELSNITKENGHPNKAGMAEIERQILTII